MCSVSVLPGSANSIRSTSAVASRSKSSRSNSWRAMRFRIARPQVATRSTAIRRLPAEFDHRLRGRFPAADFELLRLALGAADFANLVAHLERGVHHLGIPLFAGAVLENAIELRVRNAFAVRTI